MSVFKKGVRLVLLSFIFALLLLSIAAAQDVPPATVHPETEQLLQTHEKIPVFLKLREQPERQARIAAALDRRGITKGELLERRKQKTRETREAFKQAIAERRVAGKPLIFDYEFETIGVIGLNITREELEQLRNNPAVEYIAPQKERQISLAQSIPIIGADDVINLSVNGTNITGAGQVICVIDTGIQLDHEAFTNKVVGGYDFVNNDNNPSDDHGHGSHVSGTAAGNKTSATRVIGVAPDALIMPLKVCNSGGSCADANILRGVEACINNATNYNITAISGSLGGGGPYTASSCSSDPLNSSLEPLFTTALSLGIIPVFASGNNGFTTGIGYPACSLQVISVGRTEKDDTIASSSNRGGDRLDVYAPGGSILASYFGSSTATTTMSGTSMSTPHVSGAVALIQYNQRRQGLPSLNLSSIRALLNSTGKNIGSTSYRVDVFNAILKLNLNLTVNISTQALRNETSGSAVQFRDTTDFGQAISCVYLGTNFVGINSTKCPQFNKTAHITLAGLTTLAKPLRDGVACPTSVCQNVTFANNTLEFDVTSFSEYSSITGCPVLLNSSAILNESITVNDSCITFGASNIILDCNGKTILWNLPAPTSANGILAANKTNITIQNCVLDDINETGLGVIINFTNVSSSFLRNLTIHKNGSVSTYAVGLQSSNSNLLENLTISANGTSNNHALFLLSSNSTIANNLTLSTNGSGGYALVLSSSTENRFSDLVVSTNSSWISLSGTNNFTNLTFNSTNASVRYPETFSAAGTFALTSSIIQLGLNQTFINGTTAPFLNTSAQVTLRGLTFINPRAVFSSNDNTLFTSCSACVNQSYSAGTFVFNVTTSGSHAASENLPSFTLTISSNTSSVIRGSQLNYTLIVNNTGVGTAYNVTLQETYPVGATFNSGLPNPANNVTFTLGNITGNTAFLVNISVNVSASLAIETVLNNTAMLNSTNAVGQNTSTNSSALTTVRGTPGIITNITDTPDPVVRGTVINYSLFVNNTGDDTAYNVTLFLTYPNNTTFVNSSPSASPNTTILLGNLSSNQSMLVNVTLNTTAANGSTLNTTYSLVFENALGINTTVVNSTTTSVLGAPFLTASPTDTPDPTTAGAVLTYRITVQNTGDEIAYNTTLVDTYSSNVIFNNASPNASANKTFLLGNMSPNQTTIVNITVNVSSSFTSGTLTNIINLSHVNASSQSTMLVTNHTTTVGSQSSGGGSSGGSGGSGSGSSGSSGSSGQSSAAASTSTSSTAAAESQVATGLANAFGGVGRSSTSSSNGKGASTSGSASSAATTSAGASAAGTGNTGLAVTTGDSIGTLQLPELWKKVLPYAAVLVVLFGLALGFMFRRSRKKKLPIAHIVTSQKELIPAPQPPENFGAAPELPKKLAVEFKPVVYKEPRFEILEQIKEKEARSKAAKEAWKAKQAPVKQKTLKHIKFTKLVSKKKGKS